MEKISISFFIWQIPIKSLLRAWYCCKVVLDTKIWSLSQGGKIAYIQITSVENSMEMLKSDTKKKGLISNYCCAFLWNVFLIYPFLSIFAATAWFWSYHPLHVKKGRGFVSIVRCQRDSKESWVQEKPLVWWLGDHCQPFETFVSGTHYACCDRMNHQRPLHACRTEETTSRSILTSGGTVLWRPRFLTHPPLPPVL